MCAVRHNIGVHVYGGSGHCGCVNIATHGWWVFAIAHVRLVVSNIVTTLTGSVLTTLAGTRNEMALACTKVTHCVKRVDVN